MPDNGAIEVPFNPGAALEAAMKSGLKGTPDVATTEADKVAAAQKEADEKAAAATTAATTPPKGTPEGQEPEEEGEEVIQANLDKLAEKDEATLTPEEKAYIQKYTGEQLDEIGTVKQNFEQKFGVKLEGQYSNDEVGLVKLAEDVTKVKAQHLLVNYFEKIPYMKEFFNHVAVEKRGIETFLEKNTPPTHKTIPLKQTADSNDEILNNKIINDQKTLVRLDLLSKGMKEEDANDFINLFEDKGNLYDKAKEAFNSLDSKHQANLDARLKAEEARIQAEDQAVEQEYKAMEAILDSNNFDGVALPAADVKAFKAAMLNPIDDEGRTLIDYKRHKLNLAQRALIDYFIFKDLKIQGLGAAAQASNKKFSFKKAALENDKRVGGRTKGAGEGLVQGNDNLKSLFDVKNINFNKLREVQTQ